MYVGVGPGVSVGVGVGVGVGTAVPPRALNILICPIDEPAIGSVVPVICVAISAAVFPFAERRTASPATSAADAEVPLEVV